MRSIFVQIIAGILGIWLASNFISGVEFVGPWKTLILVGTFLGLINFFIKPILKFITLPLRMLTFGLFGLIINMALVWITDLFFFEFTVEGLIPLFWATLIIWGLTFFLPLFLPKGKPKIIEG